MLKSLFNNVEYYEYCEYCANIQKFLRTPILKFISKQLLLPYEFMCNGRNYSVCYAITTYVVHTYKNEYQKNVIKTFLVVISSFISA